MMSPIRPDEPGRLADAVGALAAGAPEPELRAQLHALSGIVRNVGRAGVPAAERRVLEERIDDELAREDEPAVIAAMRALAAQDRASIRPIDWSAASSG
jgi:hypothetical protein